MYKANEVATHYGVTLQTVYRWTESMKEFMSAGAHPDTKDKEYIYTDRDMAVFEEMNRLRNEGGSTDTIINSIRTMITMDKLPEFRGLAPPSQITLNREQATDIDSRMQLVVRERDDLRDRLIDAEKQIAVLTQQVTDADALRTEINRLHREIGKLEARIEIMNEDTP